MLWLQTSDTETDRTKPRQMCITSGINEPIQPTINTGFKTRKASKISECKKSLSVC